ncbi:MAG TPA: VWA domain-containing protein [Patescibacteria group bacterium]|nr:VWA domain-containing protein [Patescibacteria group bacterium]
MLAFRIAAASALAAAWLGGAARGAAPAAAAGPPVEQVRVVDRGWIRVGLTATVTDRAGRPVTGLDRDDFVVTENDKPIDLSDFGPEEGRSDRPLSVAVLLDLSGSMGSQIKDVEKAARALLSGLRTGDEIMVAKFNDQLTVLQPFTGDPRDLDRSLRRIGRAVGGTAIFRSIEKTLKDLRGRPGRKVILVVSDGLDNDFERSEPVLQSVYLQDLLRLCFRTQTTVYGIRPGMPSSWTPFEDFVTQSGGNLLYTGGDLARVFARLGEEFLSQYYFGYDIDPKVDERGWRRVRVRVLRTDLMVRSIQGYFTPRDQLETLLRDLEDREADMRADAAWDLGFVDDPRARSGLRAALDDRDATVRRAAIEGLARLRVAEAIPGIIERLGDRDHEVRDAASAGLDAFGPAAIDPLGRAVTAAAGSRRPGSAALGAAAALGRVGDDRAVDPLAALLHGRSDEGRAAAVAALTALGLAAGLAPLREALADEDPSVREAALGGLAAIAGAAARPVIEDHLRHENDPAVRSAARQLLEKM